MSGREPEVQIGGEPPTGRGRKPSPAVEALRTAADAHPGVWVSLDVEGPNAASTRAASLRRLGYEATQRGRVVWCRTSEASEDTE